jgi:hypothetical protein
MQTLLKPEPVQGRRVRKRRAPEPSARAGPDRWEQRFADLAAFKAAHGHCNVPSSYPEDPSLAVWVFNCRRQRKQGSLDADRVRRLDAIGFAWAVRTRRFVARDWDAMLAQLNAFHREHGHANVPHAWPRSPELAAWLFGVRCNKRSGRLNADRVRQLDALGVVWEPQQTRWEKMFAALADYGRRHGDCNVPFGWPENPALALWVKGVRAAQKRGDLDFERIRRLDSISFGWDRGGEMRWDEMYEELARYRQVNGHCRISTLSEECRSLGNWVHTQRTLRKQGRLDQERIARLDALGFAWDVRREQWDTMFAALEDYRRATGHCDVPQAWPENRKLGNWVMLQRAAYKAARLDGEQIERLLAIGFRFSIVGDRLLAARPKTARPAIKPDKRRAA